MTQVSLLKAQSYELQELRNSLASLLAPFGGMSAFVKKRRSRPA